MASCFRICFAVALLAVFSCSLPLHEHHGYTKPVANYSLHLINDTAQWSMTVPGDVLIMSKPREIKRELKRFGFAPKSLRRLDKLMLAGYTREEPYYAFVLYFADSLVHWPDTTDVGRFPRALEQGFATAFALPLPGQRRASMESDMKQAMKTLKNGAAYRKSVVTPLDVFERYSNGTRFAACFSALRDFPPADDSEAQLKFQLMLTEASFVDRHPEYPGMRTRFIGVPSANDVVAGFFRKSAAFEDAALSRIAERAATSRITLVNEQHVIPAHRELVRRLLKPLKDVGYTHLALEALKPGADSLLNAGAVLTTGHGYYTKEQVFGRLIREAIALGFTLVAYEAPANHSDREAWQADRLAEVLAKTPSAKVLALVGVDHLLEDPMSDGKQWMAAHLKHRHGIDPFTIDQIRMERYTDAFSCTLAIAEGFASDEKFDRVDANVLNRLEILPCTNCADTVLTNPEPFAVQVNVYDADEYASVIETANPVPLVSFYLRAGEERSTSIPKKNKIERYPVDSED